MNEKDEKILCSIRKNARETLTRISTKTGIPISTIYEKLKKFEDGMISKYTAIIDFQQLGYNARAHIMIKASKLHKEHLTQFLSKNEHVNSLYKINNGFDYMIDVIFKNLRDLELFMERLDEDFRVKTKITYYIIDEIKREEFMNSPIIIQS